jgi:hypothetical protein
MFQIVSGFLFGFGVLALGTRDLDGGPPLWLGLANGILGAIGIAVSGYMAGMKERCAEGTSAPHESTEKE